MANAPKDRPEELRVSMEALQRQFLVSVGVVRPKLHKFCARMCGSVLDGEDVVQEALAQAFYRLPMLQASERLEPWLFRIAHRKCLDFLRSNRQEREATVRYETEQDERAAEEDETQPQPIGETLAPLVTGLPPKERAAVLLKDLLDYRLAEVAEIVDSSVGGVKAALHRGREKLRALQAAPSQRELDARQQKLLEEYVGCFNRRDFAALRNLIASDARLEVVDVRDGKLSEASTTYFGNYASLPFDWSLSAMRLDGEPVVVLFQKQDGVTRPRSAVRLFWRDDKVTHIKDYFHVDYLFAVARLETIQELC